MLDDILNNFGVKRDQLTQAEMDTLDQWSSQLSKTQISLVDVQNHISSMLKAVEKEIAGYDTPKSFVELIFRKKRRAYLEARMYNYLMILDFITAPEKARKFIEAQLKNLSKNRPVK